MTRITFADTDDDGHVLVDEPTIDRGVRWHDWLYWVALIGLAGWGFWNMKW